METINAKISLIGLILPTMTEILNHLADMVLSFFFFNPSGLMVVTLHLAILLLRFRTVAP